MEIGYESKYHKLEKDYWWFAARRDIIFRLIGKEKRNPKILDIGCSGGALLNELKHRGFINLYGIDISKQAIITAKKQGLKDVKVCNASSLNLPDNYFDILIASDIIEHIEHPKIALKEWHRVLKKGGRLIIFAPAFKGLWSSHDIINRHYRRFTQQELLLLLTQSGFHTLKSGYWNTFLFLPLYLMNKLKSKTKKKDNLYDTSPVVSRLLLALILSENKAINAGINMPFGVSVFAIASKH